MSKWVAGCNNSGFLPESEPEVFDTYSEAKAFILQLMEDHGYEMRTLEANDEEFEQQFAEAYASATVAGGRNFSATICGVEYWIQPYE